MKINFKAGADTLYVCSIETRDEHHFSRHLANYKFHITVIYSREKTLIVYNIYNVSLSTMRGITNYRAINYSFTI